MTTHVEPSPAGPHAVEHPGRDGGDAVGEGGQPRRHGKGFVVGGFGLVGAAALTVGVLYWHRNHVAARERDELQQQVAKGPRVRVATVETTPGARTVSLPGDVHGYEQATIYAKVSGYIKDVRVQRGDHVDAGQLVAVIWSPETEDDVRAAEHSATIAQITARRFDGLAPVGVVSHQDRDTADAQQSITRAQLGRARALFGYTRVTAPFAGVVTARYVDPGALVPAATGSTEASLPVVDVSSIETLRVFVYVGQDVAPFVHPGDGVEIWQDELPDRRIPAKVTYTAGGLDPRTRTMQLEIDVDNRRWGMLPGTYAHAEIKIEEPKSPLISTEALVIRDGKTMVAEVQDGKIHYVTVGLGYNDGRKVRVVSGLSGGERVALAPPVELNDGDVIQEAQ